MDRADRYRLERRRLRIAEAERGTVLALVEKFSITTRPWDAKAGKFIITQAERDASERLNASWARVSKAKERVRDAAVKWAEDALGGDE